MGQHLAARRDHLISILPALARIAAIVLALSLMSRDVSAQLCNGVACGPVCCPWGTTCCSTAECCNPGSYCALTLGVPRCLPVGAVPCGAGYCNPGMKCGSGGTCITAGTLDCGGGVYCGPGQMCAGPGCAWITPPPPAPPPQQQPQGGASCRSAADCGGCVCLLGRCGAC